jgi:hypothetical protein
MHGPQKNAGSAPEGITRKALTMAIKVRAKDAVTIFKAGIAIFDSRTIFGGCAQEIGCSEQVRGSLAARERRFGIDAQTATLSWATDL